MATAPLRVAFVTTYRPERGNLAEYGNHLVEAAVEDDRISHIDVIANQVDGAPAVEHVTDKLTVRRLWRLGSAASLEKLVWELVKLRPDVVHLNAGIRTWGKGRVVSFAGAALAVQLRAVGLKTVTTLHHIGETMRFDSTIDSTLRLDPVTKAAMRVATKLYLKANVVTVTLGLMQRILHERLGATNVDHLSHGTFGAQVERPPEPSEPRILCFGFWGAFKDADLLVEAVRRVRARGLPAELVLGGGPHPYFPELLRELRQKYEPLGFVKFTGYVPEAKLGELFQSASIVVLPYRTNSGASGVLNLARSHGRPVAISNDPGLLEQVRDEGGSALVFFDARSLEDALVRVLEDASLRRQMGEANLAVARKLSIRTQAARLVDIFQRLQAGEKVEFTRSPVVESGYLKPLPATPNAVLYSFSPGAS